MNYPIWQLDFAGGGLLIAAMAIIHVYVAQFAVGGGLFLVLTEAKGLRENNAGILDFIKKHTRFFMLLTMVFGAVTGVGIWFTISLLNPAATSTLIHIFVFAWAIEWVFFLGEIISLFIYYYTFGRLDDRTHLTIGWIYFGCAWMSLFVINGIIDFMLTPGSWLETGGFWGGFFNPTFWPALFFRSFLAIMIAGLFGFMTATFLKDEDLRLAMVRFSAKWLLAPFILFLGSAWWYKAALPPALETMIFDRLPGLQPFMSAFVLCSALLVLGGLIMAVRMPSRMSRTLAMAMLIIGLIYLGSFEFIREKGRKPYVINNYMYANSIKKADLAGITAGGVLSSAKWVKNREIQDDTLYQAGAEIFTVLCQSCHSTGGLLNDITKRARFIPSDKLEAFYTSMGRERNYMPPLACNPAERQALTAFLTTVVRE